MLQWADAIVWVIVWIQMQEKFFELVKIEEPIKILERIWISNRESLVALVWSWNVLRQKPKS